MDRRIKKVELNQLPFEIKRKNLKGDNKIPLFKSHGEKIKGLMILYHFTRSPNFEIIKILNKLPYKRTTNKNKYFFSQFTEELVFFSIKLTICINAFYKYFFQPGKYFVH